MFLRTPVACVVVSPYRSREPAGASAFTTGGVVPLIQIQARFAGTVTLADIGDVAGPTNFTVSGVDGCCAPKGATAIVPTMSARAPRPFLFAPARVPPIAFRLLLITYLLTSTQ